MLFAIGKGGAGGSVNQPHIVKSLHSASQGRFARVYAFASRQLHHNGSFVRKPGGWPELANIPDSVWFDPLPDDELDAWEGKYSNIL